MPTTRPRVPGWHPDPEDPSLLRHWDGRRWGADRKPRPSWAPAPPSRSSGRTGKGDDGPPPPRPRRRWWLLALGAAVAAVLVVALPRWLDTTPAIPPRTVGDVAFTRQADAVCARALPALRRDRPQSREDTGSPAELARRIEGAADGLAEVAGRLRALPVAEADGPEVDRWLDDWDTYIGLGRRYAERVRGGDERAFDQIADEGTPLSRRIFVFAKANGMPSCAL